MVHVAKNNPITSCNTNTCKVTDETPPPAPTIRQAMAGAKLFGPDAQFQPYSVPAVLPATRDPAYLEIGNWEPGTKIQILNKSNSPTASFADASEVVTLEPTGRDIDSRIASVWLTQKQMDKINLDAGDSLWVRVIDEDGNPSEAVKTRLMGNGYGQPGQVVDGDQWRAASRVTLLDGEASWKQNMVLRHIADAKAPEVKSFEKKLKLEKTEEDVILRGDGLLEQDAQVRVMNGRTGSVYTGGVNAEQQLSIGLGNDMKDGDTLFISVNDMNGVAAGKFEVRYSSKCKDGRAPTKGILGAHLAGVIQPG